MSPLPNSVREVDMEALIRATEETLTCSKASLAEYASLWNEVIGMLGIRITTTNRDEHTEYIRSLTEWTKQWYPQMPIAEVLLAYQVGVLGEYHSLDMIVSLTPFQLGRVLMAYKQFRHKVLSAARAAMPVVVVVEPLPPADELERISRDYLNWAYVSVLSGAHVDDLGNSGYEDLDARGLISFTRQRKWDFVAQAQVVLQAKIARRAIVNKSLHAGLVATRLSEAIEQGVIYHYEKDAIMREAKQIAFMILLKDLIIQGVTMDDFLGTTKLPDNE